MESEESEAKNTILGNLLATFGCGSSGVTETRIQIAVRAGQAADRLKLRRMSRPADYPEWVHRLPKFGYSQGFQKSGGFLRFPRSVRPVPRRPSDSRRLKSVSFFLPTMKSSASRFLFVCSVYLIALALRARASDGVPAAPLVANDPILIEVSLIADAHAAALSGADVSSFLDTTSSPFPDPMAPSVLLARRAVTVCGWLQNDQEHGRAMKLARSVLNSLAKMKESTDADHEERLYWEALLEGRVLGQKAVAVAILEEARKICPDDDRVLELDHEFAAALNAFGH
jgi:hypothetical protein